jgi:EAL domain-containing protein (putative c-di-GMP-specific phosphodiesterase class I)
MDGAVMTGELRRWCEEAGASPHAELAAQLSASTTRVLRMARQHLGMELAWLSSMSQGTYQWRTFDGDPAPFGLSEGYTMGVPETYCARVLDGRLPSVIPDTHADSRTATMLITDRLNLGAYVGAPVMSPSAVALGMLCCVSSHAEHSLRAGDAESLAIPAQTLVEPLGVALTREHARQKFRGAAERMLDSGGISIAFQPLVEVETGIVVGAEALARFGAGGYSTEQWFTEAHDAGCGLELETDVVTEILALLPDIPRRLHIALNASADLIASGRLTGLVAEIGGDRIIVELTEHRQPLDFQILAAQIARLRKLGAQLAMDDTGTGYAGLHQILRLAPDIIKMDRVLIAGIDSDPAKRALAGALAAFCRQTGTALLAEGVETAEELRVLSALGIEYVQGYHLARPAALPEFLQHPGVHPIAQVGQILPHHR